MLALELFDGLLQVPGGLVQGAGKLAELAAAGVRQARPEIAARQLQRVGHDGGEAGREEARQKRRDGDGRQECQGRARQEPPADRVHLPVDFRERHGDANRSAGNGAGPGNGDVQKIDADRDAAADAPSRRPRKASISSGRVR